MPRVIHFEISAHDPERAEAFYKEVFGWKIDKWPGPMDYRVVTTGTEGPGINGGLLKGPGGTVNTIDVPSVEEAIAKVEANGGKVVLRKMAVPGVGYLAYCLDTEGNTFGILTPDADAK